MELIIRSYGKFLLEAVAFVAFWMLALGNIRGQVGEDMMSHIWGVCASGDQQEYGADFEQCIAESERQSPQILYRYEGVLRAGSYSVRNLFEAIDCVGDELLVEVHGVWKADGTAVAQGMYADEGKIFFQENGIYRVQLYAVDRWNNETVCDAYMPVN